MPGETLYPGMVNSPATLLTDDITNDATTIPVAELNVFPAAPNQATIRSATDPAIDKETILYTGKSAASGAGNLTGVTREFDNNGTYGLKKAWYTGDFISRNFTAKDFAAIQDGIDNVINIGDVDADHTFRGICVTGQTAGETLSYGELVYYKAADSKWWHTNNAAESTTAGDIGIVVTAAGITAESTGNICKLGYIRHNAWAWSPGDAIFIANTDGTLTQTLPTTEGIFVRKIGYAATADVIWLFPDTTVIEIGTSSGGDWSGAINMDGGSSTSNYGGTTGIICGGAV